jgi:hypothetical protein
MTGVVSIPATPRKVAPHAQTQIIFSLNDFCLEET